MVVGPDFIWLHIMKCGGHAVELGLRRALRGSREVKFDSRETDTLVWHESFNDRAARDQDFNRNGRYIVAGIRRLPYWLLSRVHYEATRAPFRCPTRSMFLSGQFFENEGIINSADGLMSRYTEPAVDKWIRQEHMAADFAACFSEPLGKRLPKAMSQLNQTINETPMEYLKDLSFYFTKDEVRRVYNANPVWAGLEERVYGDLLTV